MFPNYVILQILPSAEQVFIKQSNNQKNSHMLAPGKNKSHPDAWAAQLSEEYKFFCTHKSLVCLKSIQIHPTGKTAGIPLHVVIPRRLFF